MQASVFCLLLILFMTKESHQKEQQMNFEWTRMKLITATNNDKPFLSGTIHNQQVFYRVKLVNAGKRRVRSISDAVIETTRCEHIELMDCGSYDSDEMTCMITATGFPCCICSGKLKVVHKRQWGGL